MSDAKIPILPPTTALKLIASTSDAPQVLPRLSAKARERITETIEMGREIGERQIASDIEFLLELHDRVHGIAAP